MYSVAFFLTLIIQYACSTKPGNTLNRSAYIINGVATSIDKHPYTALFLNDGHTCGGVVINTFTVVTAAHCFEPNIEVEQMLIVVGITFAYEVFSMPNRYKISRFVAHPNFVYTTFDSDIALLFVIGPIRLGKRVQKAYLAVDETFKKATKHRNFIVVGWGFITNNGPQADRLMSTRLKYLPKHECKKLHTIELTENMFCLQSKFKTSACYGDSGGGVIWNRQLVGIISHIDGSKSCADPENPGVFTNIVPFRPWIKETIDWFLELCHS